MLPYEPVTLMQLAMIVPLVAAVLIPVFGFSPNLREGVTLVAAAILAVIVWSLIPPILAGERPDFELVEVVPGLRIAFELEPLGLIFALVAGSLWFLNSIYSIGYMRKANEPRQTQFYVCFAVAISSALALAFSKNLFSMFLFYEVLSLSTYPLVTHKGTEAAMKAGRVYLMLLMGTSIALFLPGIVGIYVISGTLDFTPGGVLAEAQATPFVIGGLLALFAFGIGKAAVVPFHFWLPAAMVAPTPVSALLHAVAVVKAGVFSVLKVVVYIFGIDTLTGSGANAWLVYLASFGVIMASIVALNQDNLKARLAYSTVSQLAYIVLGAALATAASVTGGALHIVMHAVGKITLFFCAGAIYVAHKKTEVSQLDGIGKLMPFTMGAFLIASLSIIGLPPFGGTWSKWFLALGALDSQYQFAVAVFMISSLLNVAYLMPIVARAFFKPPPDAAPITPVRMAEAPLACVVPICITAVGCLVLFFMAEPVAELAQMIDLRAVDAPQTADGATPGVGGVGNGR
ncbi:MAG: monovalent cation/H+ antiporter subunit D family protein [Pseudomonadota bacterium]